MTDINVPLLQRTLDFIEANPEKWDQKELAHKVPCGTVYCLAGTAVVLSGCELAWDGRSWTYRTADGEHIWFKAQDLLGLNDGQAEEIFDEGCALEDLWRLAERFTGGAITRGVS